MARKSLKEHKENAANKELCASCAHFNAAQSYCDRHNRPTSAIASCAAIGASGSFAPKNQLHMLTESPAAAGVLKPGISGFQELSENETPAGREFDESVADEMLGMVKMAEAFSSFASATALMKLQQVKEHGLYRKYGNWESYCRRLGKSVNAVDEQLQNLDALGAEAFDKLKQIGATRQDFRRLRKMEDDDQKLLVQEIEANIGDREGLLELIEELGEKNRKERGELEARLKRAQSDADGNEKLLANQAKELTALKKKVIELEDKKQLPTPDEKMQGDYDTLQAKFRELQVGDDGVQALRLYLNEALASYQDENGYGEMPLQLRELAANGIAALVTDLRFILQEFSLDNAEDIMAAMTGEQFDPTQEY
jgi:hypothetical protein